jgi:membrane protein YqaA with SNARE-associated domain
MKNLLIIAVALGASMLGGCATYSSGRWVLLLRRRVV